MGVTAVDVEILTIYALSHALPAVMHVQLQGKDESSQVVFHEGLVAVQLVSQACSPSPQHLATFKRVHILDRKTVLPVLHT